MDANIFTCKIPVISRVMLPCVNRSTIILAEVRIKWFGISLISESSWDPHTMLKSPMELVQWIYFELVLVTTQPSSTKNTALLKDPTCSPFLQCNCNQGTRCRCRRPTFNSFLSFREYLPMFFTFQQTVLCCESSSFLLKLCQQAERHARVVFTEGKFKQNCNTRLLQIRYRRYRL